MPDRCDYNCNSYTTVKTVLNSSATTANTTFMKFFFSQGLALHSFHGNFFVRSTDLLALPNVNPDSACGIQVSMDDNLTDVSTVCFQSALLYTSSRGMKKF